MSLFTLPTAALFVAPLLGSIATSLFTRLAKKEIPPFMPQLNSYSFGQAIIIIVAGLGAEKPSSNLVLHAFLAFLILVFLFLFQAWIDQEKKEKTDQYTSEVIDQHIREHIKPGVTIERVTRIAQSFIEEDFFSTSIPQKLSGYPRQKRREQFADLLNNDLTIGLPQQISQRDFLVPEERTRTLKWLYSVVNILSFGFYVYSVHLFMRALA